MKKVFIVHRWSGNPKADWYPWLKDELEKKGFEVVVPEMPNPDEPRIDEWVSHLKKIAGKLDEDTYFIGHSVGCQTILRYLDNLPRNVKINNAILIAPWLHLNNLETDEEKEIAKPWLETPINFDKIRIHSNNFLCLFSDNDPYVPLSDKDIFKELLGAEIIVEHEKGHFTSEDGITELPSVLKEIIK